MELQNISSKDTHLKGMFVRLNRGEAFRLAISLMEQIRTNNPNAERVEFYPQASKGCNYFTISVTPEPDPPNLHKIVREISEEVCGIIPEGETPHKRGIRKGVEKVYQIVYSKLISHQR